MNQHEVPAYTVATLGHPANGVMIVKTRFGPWLRIDSGVEVQDIEFRAGWDIYTPEPFTDSGTGGVQRPGFFDLVVEYQKPHIRRAAEVSAHYAEAWEQVLRLAYETETRGNEPDDHTD